MADTKKIIAATAGVTAADRAISRHQRQRSYETA